MCSQTEEKDIGDLSMSDHCAGTQENSQGAQMTRRRTGTSLTPVPNLWENRDGSFTCDNVEMTTVEREHWRLSYLGSSDHRRVGEPQRKVGIAHHQFPDSASFSLAVVPNHAALDECIEKTKKRRFP